MRHKDIEFQVTQGIERATWHWSVAIEGVDRRGRKGPIKRRGVEPSREKALGRAVEAIDRLVRGPKVLMRRRMKS